MQCVVGEHLNVYFRNAGPVFVVASPKAGCSYMDNEDIVIESELFTVNNDTYTDYQVNTLVKQKERNT